METVVTGAPALDKNFWRGRDVLVTGHTGFKGSWLCLLLHSLGARLHGYALPPQPGTVFEAANVSHILRSQVLSDVCDLTRLTAAMTVAKPSVVLHLAAQALVRLSYQDPVSTYATNVMGTVNVLEAVRRLGSVESVVIVTSDKCYENREWVWGYRENEAMGGHDPYSNSKGCAELVVSAYRRSFFDRGSPRIASGRAGNVVGGGDRARDRLVPDLVAAAHAGHETSIRNPSAVRPWQHVLEPLTGYIQLAQKLAGAGGACFADGWNFGPDEGAERTVADVADAVCRYWGHGARWTRDLDPQPHEAHFLKLDSSNARQLLGWRAVWDFEDTFRETVAWYRACVEGLDMSAFTLAQIASYCGSLELAPLPLPGERSPVT